MVSCLCTNKYSSSSSLSWYRSNSYTILSISSSSSLTSFSSFTISKASLTEPLRVQSSFFFLSRRMLSSLSIQNALARSSLIRCSYVGLSPCSLRLFLLISSASPHLVMCGALWSKSLRHPSEQECSNSNTSYTPSRWAHLLCQSTSSLSSPSWTTWWQWLIQLPTLTSSLPCSIVCLPNMIHSSPPSTHESTLYCQKNSSPHA